MSFENRISLKISPEDQATIGTALTNLQEILAPHLKALNEDERLHLTKMGEGNLPFVEKTLDYSTSNPELGPVYLDVAEFKIDVDAVNLLTDYMRVLIGLLSNLKDTHSLAGSEAMEAALSYYHSVKQAAKMNVPGAKPIHEDLAKRFKHGKKAKGDAPDEGTGNDNLE